MELQEAITELEQLATADSLEGMSRFGINVDNALGVSIPNIRALAKKIGKDHALAEQLWQRGVHEASILGAMVDDPTLVTEEQLERWVKDIDSWDVCDLACGNLFDKTAFAYDKAFEWSKRDEEFVKRCGFVLMAALAVHDKKASNRQLATFFPVIKREATDERNFVKKAVNWALRQLGKRNGALNKQAVKTAEQILRIDSRAARWIARDALRELKSEKIQRRLK